MIAAPRAIGADVSHFHPVVDWNALAGSVSFLGVKATQSITFVDPTFVAHRDGFRASSIPLAIYYHFAVPGDPQRQAQALARAVGVAQPNERMCLDVEQLVAPGGDNLGWVDTFFRTLMGGACGGKRPLIYTSARIWREFGDPSWDLATEIDLWIPRYAITEPELPRPWNDWLIWQHAQDAAVPGISGPCDADVWNGTTDDVRAYAA
jgi:lysozyme